MVSVEFSLLAFLGASLILAATPGPGVAYVVTRSLVHGRRAGLASVAGVAVGNAGNALVASTGLATLFAVSSLAFTIVKLAGAVYLVWMGLRMLGRAWHRAGHAPLVSGEGAQLPGQPATRVFRDGFWVALFNPKTALFYAAFLPQFVSGDWIGLKCLGLGLIFVVIAAATDAVYALLASRLNRRLAGSVRWRRAGEAAGGATFIGLGLLTAAADAPVRAG